MIIYIIAFILGTIVGSFLNVCIHRLPEGKSIITPRSSCPKCNKPIPWHDNIPLLSYIFLRGKCRFCKQKIPFSYFLVELFTGFLFLIFLVYFDLTIEFIIFLSLTCALVVITFIDLKHKIIPDEITLGGLALGLALSFFYPSLHGAGSRWMSIFRSGIGVLVGGGSLYCLGVVGEFMFKKEAMGGGDVKLLAMIGSFLGWQAVLLTIFLSAVFGSIVGIVLKLKLKLERIPYGPFLALGAVISIFWGKRIFALLLGR